MDLGTHVLVGSLIGAKFGHPWVGGIAAMMPDLCLGIKRRQLPNMGYNIMHSLLVLCTVGGVLLFIPMDVKLYWSFMLCWFSHILLDYPTHGPAWAPQTFYPLNKARHTFGQEWEFFDETWWEGATIALCFVLLITFY